MEILVRSIDSVVISYGKNLPRELAGTVWYDITDTLKEKQLMVALTQSNQKITYANGSLSVVSIEPVVVPIYYTEDEIDTMIDSVKTIADIKEILKKYFTKNLKVEN